MSSASAPATDYYGNKPMAFFNNHIPPALRGDWAIKELLELKEFAESLGIKTVVLQVETGESDQEAWQRYLIENPDDASAMLKIFNHQRPEKALAVSPLKLIF